MAPQFCYDYDPWRLLSSEPKEPRGVMTDAFVMKYAHYMNWKLLSCHYEFSFDMLRTFQHRVVWSFLLKRVKFPESFLREMHLNFDYDAWYVVSKYQQLSEEFINDFALKVDWESIRNFQVVSEKFLRDHNQYLQADAEEATAV